MGVYVSLSPGSRQNLTPADILHQLQSAGFSIAGHVPGECEQDCEIDPEASHATLFEMRDDQSNLVEVEINHHFPSHFCVWWRYSWSIGSHAYAQELSHLLDLADRLGWEMHGNTGKAVTRDTLSDEVERLTGDSAAVKSMFGTVPCPPEEEFSPELLEEAAKMFQAMLPEAMEAIAKEHADKSKTDET